MWWREVSSTIVHLKSNDYSELYHLPHVTSHVGMGIAVPTWRGVSRPSILPHALRFPRQLRAVSTRLSQGVSGSSTLLTLQSHLIAFAVYSPMNRTNSRLNQEVLRSQYLPPLD